MGRNMYNDDTVEFLGEENALIYGMHLLHFEFEEFFEPNISKLFHHMLMQHLEELNRYIDKKERYGVRVLEINDCFGVCVGRIYWDYRKDGLHGYFEFKVEKDTIIPIPSHFNRSEYEEVFNTSDYINGEAIPFARYYFDYEKAFLRKMRKKPH